MSVFRFIFLLKHKKYNHEISIVDVITTDFNLKILTTYSNLVEKYGNDLTFP